MENLLFLGFVMRKGVFVIFFFFRTFSHLSSLFMGGVMLPESCLLCLLFILKLKVYVV